MVNRPRLVFAYPGQGSQRRGMGSDLLRDYPQIAQPLHHQACHVLGYDLTKIMLDGPQETLDLTQHAQPAIVLDSVIRTEVLQRELGLEPIYVVGHSLGEYSALIGARVASLEDILALVQKRAQLMQQATPLGSSLMAAVIGKFDSWGGRWRLRQICRRFGTEIANVNSSSQVVIAGLRQRVLDARAALEALGCRVIELRLSIAGHCSLMERAKQHLAQEIERVHFQPPLVPIISAQRGRIISGVRKLKHEIKQQLTNQVRWDLVTKRLRKEEIQAVIEVGAVNVLSRLTEGLPMYSFQDALRQLKPAP